jgi:hypothetical protein
MYLRVDWAAVPGENVLGLYGPNGEPVEVAREQPSICDFCSSPLSIPFPRIRGLRIEFEQFGQTVRLGNLDIKHSDNMWALCQTRCWPALSKHLKDGQLLPLSSIQSYYLNVAIPVWATRFAPGSKPRQQKLITYMRRELRFIVEEPR